MTIEVTPKSALLKRGGKPFFARELVVAPGEKVELEASARGMATKTVVIDGSTPKVSIDLAAPPGASTTVIRPPPITSKHTDGVTETW